MTQALTLDDVCRDLAERIIAGTDRFTHDFGITLFQQDAPRVIRYLRRIWRSKAMMSGVIYRTGDVLVLDEQVQYFCHVLVCGEPLERCMLLVDDASDLARHLNFNRFLVLYDKGGRRDRIAIAIQSPFMGM